MRVFVCSPLRGPDGHPSEQHRELARRLMRAVFDAGHAPFVPHLLYPQVLSESQKDLDVSFKANFAFLDVCDEIWVYAYGYVDCSKGMKLEVDYALRTPIGARVVYMPAQFAAVKKAFEQEQLTTTQSIGYCMGCQALTGLNSQRICLTCFSGGTPT